MVDVNVTLPGGYGMIPDSYHQAPAAHYGPPGSYSHANDSVTRGNGHFRPPSYSGASPGAPNALNGTIGPSDVAYMIHGNHSQAGGPLDALSGTIGPGDSGKDFLHIGLMTTKSPPAQGARGVMATRDALDAPAGCTTIAENFQVPGTRELLNKPGTMHPGHARNIPMQPGNGLMTMDCVFGVLEGTSGAGTRGPGTEVPHGRPHNPRGPLHQVETTVATVVGLGNEQPMPPLPPNAEMLFGPGSRAIGIPGHSLDMSDSYPLHGGFGASTADHDVYAAAESAVAPVAPAALPRPGIAPHEAKQRAAWDVGSIVEIYSSSAGRWHVSHVTKVERGSGPDVLTMQFYVDDGAKNKALYRTDPQLAPFGTRTWGELPAGMEVKPSQNRAGKFICFDMRTGAKYQSPELAWAWYFEQMQKAASTAATMETNYSVASSSAAATNSKAHPAQPMRPCQHTPCPQPAPCLQPAQTQRPAHADQHQAPAYGGQHQAPAYGGQHQAPAYGGQHQAPTYGGQHQAPAYGSQHQAPGYGNQHQAPGYGGQHQAPGYGSQHQAPGYGGQHQAPACGGDQMPSQKHAGDALMTTYAGHVAVAAAATAAARAKMDVAHGKVPLPAF